MNKKFKKQKIEIEEYNPEWPQIFASEAAKIKEALADNFIAIHHVGSTSVPGLCAKPKIDLIVVVKDPTKSIPDLEKVGIDYKGEYSIPMHYGFSKRGDINLNVHVYEDGNPEIELNLLFRDYLRNNADDLNEYADLKKKLLQEESSFVKYENSFFAEYNYGKNAFIKKILNKAGLDNIRIHICTHREEKQEYISILKENTDITDFSENYILNDDDNCHLVMYKGTTIVAIANIKNLSSDKPNLVQLFVDKGQDNKGYREKMIEFLNKWIQSKNKTLLLKGLL